MAEQQPVKNHYKFINLWQSSEERKAKYWLLRSLGANSYHAMRMRDWRLSKIERLFNLPSYHSPTLIDKEYHIAGPVAPSVAQEPATG